MADILIITEDELLTQRLIADLSPQGHSVRSARTGRIGLEKASTVCPDVVFLDLIMSTMDGFEIMPKLRGIAPSAKIVAMCEDIDRIPAGNLLRIALKMGAQYTLAKPFSAQELDLALQPLLPTRSDTSPIFLVLDDDATSRYLNRRALQKAFPSSTVVECDSPAEALAATETTRLDAIITDHHLGQEDGAEFVKSLRSQGVRCPVLMVTGSSDPEVHQRAYRAGADRVFFGANLNFSAYLKNRLAVPPASERKSE